MVTAKNARLFPSYPELCADSGFSEEHVHNIVRWYTKRTAQTATNWCAPVAGNLANFYRCISGAGTWGTDGSHDPAAPPSDEAFLFGTGDLLTELGTNLAWGDFDKVLILQNSSNTLYLMRFIYGLGTMADAIAANQYTEMVWFRPAADNNRRVYEMKMPRVPVIGYKLWAQCQNATDNATIDFVLGVHAYPAPEL
jgi:hypothetical protein